MKRPSTKPTKRDLEVLATVAKIQADTSAHASRRQVATVGQIPEGTVQNSLRRLQRFGLASWAPGMARTISVTLAGSQALNGGVL